MCVCVCVCVCMALSSICVNWFCTVLLLKMPRVNKDFAVVLIVQVFSLVWTLLKTVKAF